MILILSFVVSLSLTISAYALHRGSLAYAGVLAWLATGVGSVMLSEGSWNVYMILFWVCIVMFITSAIEGATLSKPEEQAEERIEYSKELDAAKKNMGERINYLKGKRRI